MFTPPAEVGAVCAAFASLFTRPSWRRAQALFCGLLLAPSNHVLTAALRALGLADDVRFQSDHRLLNRARWYGGALRWLEVSSDTAVWYHGGLPPVALRWLFIRDPKGRFEPQALRLTDADLPASQIISRFVRRGRWKSPSRQARAHRGVDGQRQWNDLAAARSTALRLALFSLVALPVHRQPNWQTSVRQAAWYKKALPTFSDALAQVRRCLWRQLAFCMSQKQIDSRKPPADLFAHSGELLAYAP